MTQMRLQGEVDRELDIFHRRRQVDLLGAIKIGPLTVITSVAIDAEDLDAEPLLNHQHNELVSLFPRQANKVELHRVTEILGLGEWLWNVDIRVVANQRFKVPVIALVNLVNLRQARYLRP